MHRRGAESTAPIGDPSLCVYENLQKYSHRIGLTNHPRFVQRLLRFLQRRLQPLFRPHPGLRQRWGNRRANATLHCYGYAPVPVVPRQVSGGQWGRSVGLRRHNGAIAA